MTTPGTMPMRETVIMVALINHPLLIDEHFEAIERLDLKHPDLRRLHAGLLDAIADNAEMIARGEDSQFMNKVALATGGKAPKEQYSAKPAKPEHAANSKGMISRGRIPKQAHHSDLPQRTPAGQRACVAAPGALGYYWGEAAVEVPANRPLRGPGHVPCREAREIGCVRASRGRGKGGAHAAQLRPCLNIAQLMLCVL